MAHIHELIDFVVVCYIVKDGKVLLCHHKKLDMWLPIGGHIELHESPDEALYREIAEETKLTVNVDGHLSAANLQSVLGEAVPQIRPRYMEMHNFDKVSKHKHVALVYFGYTYDKPICSSEHHELRWFDRNALHQIKDTEPSVIYYANGALQNYGY